MRQRSRIIVVGTLLLLAIGGFAAVSYLQKMDREVAQPARDLSKMMSVRLILGEALSKYYEQHGSFPDRIHDLPLQTLPWGHEGSSAVDVKRWTYVSDGKSFTMRWEGKRDYKLFLGGRTGKVFYSEDEFEGSK